MKSTYMFSAIILTTTLLLSIGCTRQANVGNKKIRVSFTIDDSAKSISDSFKIYFVNGRDSLQGFIEKDFFKLPILKDSLYSIIFLYKADTMLFVNVPKTMIVPKHEMGWAFGIDNRPFNSILGLLSSEEYKQDVTTKQIYYLQFQPEGLDGVVMVRKKPSFF